MTHTVTDKIKAQVTALKSFGSTNEDIANYLGIHHETLTKYYKYELNTALTSATAQVAGRLFKKAVEDGDVTAMIFWLKTRARWRTEDSKVTQESNDEVKAELKALREKLDTQNKRDY